MNRYSPIALFTYNRPWHTQESVEALLKNEESAESDLIVFSDGARDEASRDKVNEVRSYMRTVHGFKSIRVIEREANLGLACSIIQGVAEVVNEFGRIIVLEDDLVTSPFFLKYMNDALSFYEKEKSVISIHGYIYPTQEKLPETFFLRGADCWGWATWQRGWEYFNPDGRYLFDELKRLKLLRAFDFNGASPHSKMLEGQIKGKNDSWAVRWYASAFLAGKLTLYPGRSLIHNIGNDESGTHCDKSDKWNSSLSKTPIDLRTVSVEPSQQAMQAFKLFFRQHRKGWLKKLSCKLWSMLNWLR